MEFEMDISEVWPYIVKNNNQSKNSCEMADAVPQSECSKQSKSGEDTKLDFVIIEEERAAEQAAFRAIKEAIRINGIRCSREESTRSPVTVALDSERESLFLFNTFAVDLIERANCT